MNCLNKLRPYLPVLFVFSSLFCIKTEAASVPGFPQGCDDSTMQNPLDGHIIRAGKVYWRGGYGWSFSFPDQQNSQFLQRVSIAENVGFIDDDPTDDIYDLNMAPTPPGFFAIAQILVGDPDAEPIVTCLSEAIPLRRFSPSYYLGAGWDWLRPDIFSYRLKWKRYTRWNWQKWWGRNYFDSYRQGYRRFKDRIAGRRFDRDRRDRDRDGRWDRRQRPGVVDRDRRDSDRRRDGDGRFDRRTMRPGVEAIMKKRDGDHRDRRDGDGRRDRRRDNRNMGARKGAPSAQITKARFDRPRMDEPRANRQINRENRGADERKMTPRPGIAEERSSGRQMGEQRRNLNQGQMKRAIKKDDDDNDDRPKGRG